MDLQKATEVFVRGFCTTKSAFHPYLPMFVDGLWVMRDGPGRKIPRKIEVVAAKMRPESVVARVKALDLPWHFLVHVHSSDEEFESVRKAYKGLGYRAMSTEWLFWHDLEEIPTYNSAPPVRYVDSEAIADLIPRSSNKKFERRTDRRLYAVWDDKRDCGWVYSVPVGENAWVADLYVYAELRGRGYGKALMSRLLRHDKEIGVKASVLVASSDGARIYPKLGYQKLATVQLFAPLRK